MNEIIIKTEQKQHPDRLLRADECFKIDEDTVTLYHFTPWLCENYHRETSVSITDFKDNGLVIRGHGSEFEFKTRNSELFKAGILISWRKRALIPIRVPCSFQDADTALSWIEFGI